MTRFCWLIAALLSWPSFALAQTDAGTIAQENRDIAGRWLGATDAAAQEFGKVGGTLTNASLGKFEGVSRAISKADWAASYGALSAGDVRGAVSGAVAIKVGAAATASGASLFGEVGAVTGGVVGSFFPVIGNVAGTMVGGAIGTAAGGFITAYGYDKYIKDYVTKGVVAGIASVFDTAPLDQAMQARRAFLLQTMTPDQQAQLQTFKPEEVTLLDFGTLPYVPVLKRPAGTQQQAALPPMTRFRFEVQGGDGLVIDDCRVDGADVRCTTRIERPASWVRSYSGSAIGRLEGATLTATATTHRVIAGPADPSCVMTEDYKGPVTYVLDPNGTARVRAGPIQRQTTLSGSCSGGNSGSYTGDATLPWRVLE